MKHLLAASAVTLLCFNTSIVNSQTYDTEIVFINKADSRIIHINSKAPSDDDWGADLLDGSILPGRKRRIEVSNGIDCRRDILVTNNLGGKAYFDRIDSCTRESIELKEIDYEYSGEPGES